MLTILLRPDQPPNGTEPAIFATHGTEPALSCTRSFIWESTESSLCMEINAESFRFSEKCIPCSDLGLDHLRPIVEKYTRKSPRAEVKAYLSQIKLQMFLTINSAWLLPRNTASQKQPWWVDNSEITKSFRWLIGPNLPWLVFSGMVLLGVLRPNRQAFHASAECCHGNFH